MQERYDQLLKSGATAISSDMMFGSEAAGRRSQPETVSLGQRLSDQYQAARLTAGSNGLQSAKETAGIIYEKGTYVANGAYTKASQAKHAALDWFATMTTNSQSN